MSDCCSSAGHKCHPNKARCPACGGECAEVSPRTMLHHIAQPWAWQPAAQRYFFCDEPDCEVVYFGEDGSTLGKSQLRGRVGAKDKAGDGPLCYCFGASHEDYRRDPALKDYVVAQTKAGLCSCDTRNPSGRCCLKDFPKL